LSLFIIKEVIMGEMTLNLDSIAVFFSYFLGKLDSKHQASEVNLGHLVYFAVNGLAMIGKLETVLSPEARANIIEWVYSHQTVEPEVGGFRYSGCRHTPSHKIEEMNLAVTFTSLAVLLLLKDDLSRVDTERILAGIRAVQNPLGAFRAQIIDSEYDVRFTFCAAAIMRMLGRTNGVDIEKAIDFILKCQSYEGGFGWVPGDEAHGGATYCAVASLAVWGALDRIRDRRLLAHWLSRRQDGGFNGRTMKPGDTCYSFWVGSPIVILGWYDQIVNKRDLIDFIARNYCTSKFRANSERYPDLTHTHFSLAGLSFLGFPGIKGIDPILGIVKEVLSERVLFRSSTQL
jgi:geranylgeranyl transferase type-1 subunit beta